MSVYLVKGKGWRYDFTLKGQRYTEAWFKTKKEAKQAEAKAREELKKPKQEPKTQTDMVFLDLINKRLDYVKAYNSEKYYLDYIYKAKKWAKEWGKLSCSEITQDMISRYILQRSKISAYTANVEIRYLRATFNFGMKKKLVFENPVNGIDFLPVEKKIKYVPSPDDLDKVIEVADPDTQDYLWVIRETMARVGEVNRLTWEDVNLKDRYVVLYTRKKKGGHLTPRKIPMTNQLHEILSRRFAKRDETKPWVFWHRYWSKKQGDFVEGPYQDRKGLMRSLCKKAGVKYFRFHPIRHASASVMDNSNVPISVTQRILGHENRTTTEIYLHSIGNSERDAMAVYERARKKSHTDSHTN